MSLPQLRCARDRSGIVILRGRDQRRKEIADQNKDHGEDDAAPAWGECAGLDGVAGEEEDDADDQEYEADGDKHFFVPSTGKPHQSRRTVGSYVCRM